MSLMHLMLKSEVGNGRTLGRETFDAGRRAVLDEVRVNLDLDVLNDFVRRWWISAATRH
jgi:hypothetical protein